MNEVNDSLVPTFGHGYFRRMTSSICKSVFPAVIGVFSCNVTERCQTRTNNPAPSRPRRKRKSYALLILAAGIFLFGVAAGTLYYVLRPITLRIAVGPAGSDDQKLVQLMAQTFARDGSAIRLAPIATEGAAESIALFSDGQGRPCGGARRSEPAGQCRIRRHPAQERRRAVGAFRHCAKGLQENADAARSRASTNSPDTASASSDERRPTSRCCA